MKRMIAAGICAVLLLCTGCAESSTEAPETAQGLNVQADEGVDAEYAECLKAYFEAVEHRDYDAYRAVLYPPYAEAYSAYLEKEGTDPKDAFAELCSQFDEDGYESWTLTELTVSYYPEEKVDLDDFFKRYASAGIFDNDFGEKCKKEAEEIRDLQFSLYAQYAGDEEAVPVVKGSELIAVKTADGTYLFG